MEKEKKRKRKRERERNQDDSTKDVEKEEIIQKLKASKLPFSEISQICIKLSFNHNIFHLKKYYSYIIEQEIRIPYFFLYKL